MANALKHATPTTLTIDIAHHNGDLRVVVSDDGCGGAKERKGSGWRVCETESRRPG